MPNKNITLLKVSQWMSSWGSLLDQERQLPEVPRCFYVGSMSIKDLRVLAGVPTRTIVDRERGAQDAGFQRALEPSRSKRVGEYLRWGFPISSHKIMSDEKRHKLINPGWLPGAIIVNIRRENDVRQMGSEARSVHESDRVTLIDGAAGVSLEYPCTLQDQRPGTHPIEIIDGQHRVFSIDDFGDDLEVNEDLSRFEVPVVFFYGLSVKWQAYLFWVINVEPKKINPSLAFDLYPELRRQDWLEEYDELKVYREHRAQELTELLWRHEESPWKGRIELLGGRKPGHVSNAAFIRSLLASFVKNAKQDHSKGGLFGSVISRGDADRLLQWSRPQQAALLIQIWDSVKSAVVSSTATWVESVAAVQIGFEMPDPKMVAFQGRHALLSTDQGVRAIHGVFNDYLRSHIDDLHLNDWIMGEGASDADLSSQVSAALASLRQKDEIISSLNLLSQAIVNDVDWRLPSAPGITENSQEFLRQNSFRGSTGYRLLYETIEAALLGRGIDLSPDAIDVE